MMIEIYTDGSATTKNKPGGWAYVIVIDGEEQCSGSGSMPSATNNDAEMEAAIVGLAIVLKDFPTWSEAGRAADMQVTLCSDSEIILNWANGGYRFKQATKMHKYAQLRELVRRLQVRTRWVEGHAGHEFNEKCDKMARAERRKAMGQPPKKESSKSTLMLRAIKEIANIASQALNGSPELDNISSLCAPFVGNK